MDNIVNDNTANEKMAKLQQFSNICDVISNTPQKIPLPSDWIAQVVVNSRIIMWSEWSAGYSKITKHIILSEDMVVKVSYLIF